MPGQSAYPEPKEAQPPRSTKQPSGGNDPFAFGPKDGRGPALRVFACPTDVEPGRTALCPVVEAATCHAAMITQFHARERRPSPLTMRLVGSCRLSRGVALEPRPTAVIGARVVIPRGSEPPRECAALRQPTRQAAGSMHERSPRPQMTAAEKSPKCASTSARPKLASANGRGHGRVGPIPFSALADASSVRSGPEQELTAEVGVVPKGLRSRSYQKIRAWSQSIRDVRVEVPLSRGRRIPRFERAIAS